MKCEWSQEKGDGYFRCTKESCRGRATKREAKRQCDADPAKKAKARPHPCRHLGDFQSNELTPCTTCRGNVRLKYPINACEKHTTCLPTYRGEHETMTCAKCIAGKLGYEPKEIP